MRTFKLGLVTALILIAAGCATVNGAGQDISSAGHAISTTAQEASK